MFTGISNGKVILIWAITGRVSSYYISCAKLLQSEDPCPSPFPSSPSNHKPCGPVTWRFHKHFLYFPNFLTAHLNWLPHRDYFVWIYLWVTTTRSTSTPHSWLWSAQLWISRLRRVWNVWNCFVTRLHLVAYEIRGCTISGSTEGQEIFAMI